jgi:hypothetical protein
LDNTGASCHCYHLYRQFHIVHVTCWEQKSHAKILRRYNNPVRWWRRCGQVRGCLRFVVNKLAGVCGLVLSLGGKGWLCNFPLRSL